MPTEKNIICIDSGNTRSKFAIYKNNVLVHFGIITDNLLALIKANKITTAIYCSVKKEDIILEQLLLLVEDVFFLDDNMLLPFDSNYKSMHTLGKDRIALMASAQKKFANTSTLVIALGTCITYNFLENGSLFLGGGIAPGLQMRLKAMHDYTQKLPLVANIIQTPLIGADTISSLQSGAINGVLAEITGIINAYEAQFGRINLVLTGGDMPQFESQLKKQIFADANFLFEGMLHLYNYNKPNS